MSETVVVAGLGSCDLFSDDYDSLQSHSDVVKSESQPAASESFGPSASTRSNGVSLSADDKTNAADGDEVLNLVKVKKTEELADTDAGSVTKETDDEKHDVKLSKLLKCDEMKKECERDDDDTLSESETTTAAKPLMTTTAAMGDGVDAAKDKAAMKLIQKSDVDDDHSAIPSPCPEVCRHKCDSLGFLVCK